MSILKIGIVVADIEEYKPLADFAQKGEYNDYSFLGRKGHSFKVKSGNSEAEVISILCGIGKVNAAAVAAHFVDIGCDVIMNYGLSGGISSVRRGDICICDRFLEHDFDLTGIGYKPCEKPLQKYIYGSDDGINGIAKKIIPNVKIGTAVSGDSFVCDDFLRDSLKNNFGAMSCDMESAAEAYICSEAGVPFCAVRRISDDAGEEATENYRSMNSLADSCLIDIFFDSLESICSENF